MTLRIPEGHRTGHGTVPDKSKDARMYPPCHLSRHAIPRIMHGEVVIHPCPQKFCLIRPQHSIASRCLDYEVNEAGRLALSVASFNSVRIVWAFVIVLYGFGFSERTYNHAK